MTNDEAELPDDGKLTDDELDQISGGTSASYVNILRKVINDGRELLGMERWDKK